MQVDWLEPVNTTFKVPNWVNPSFHYVPTTLRTISAKAVEEFMEVAQGSYVATVGKLFGANALAEYIGGSLVENNANEIAALYKQGS